MFALPSLNTHRVSEWTKPTLIQAIDAHTAVLRANSDASAAGSDDDVWKPLLAVASGDDSLLQLCDERVMHAASCADRSVCLGCSGAWRVLQRAPDQLRAWGSQDLLRFDPEHGASARIDLAPRPGVGVGLAVEPLACDLVHALVRVGAPGAVCVWYFVPPYHVAKLRRSLRAVDGDFVSPQALLAADVDALTATQAVHDTVFVPPGWLSFRVHAVRPPATAAETAASAVAVHWRLLRPPSLTAAQRGAHAQRLSAAATPTLSVSLTGIAIVAASEKLDLLEQLLLAESTGSASRDELQRERRAALLVLQHVLPTLQAEVLEDVADAPVGVSALSALMYEPALLSVESGVPSALQAAVIRASNSSDKRRSADADADLNPGDRCHSCNVALFNLRRVNESIMMCTSCYNAFGYKHSMQLCRRVEPDSLKRLVRAVSIAVGLAGTGLEFLNKREACIVGNADGHADADMPLSSFSFSVYQQQHGTKRSNQFQSQRAYQSSQPPQPQLPVPPPPQLQPQQPQLPQLQLQLQQSLSSVQQQQLQQLQQQQQEQYQHQQHLQQPQQHQHLPKRRRKVIRVISDSVGSATAQHLSDDDAANGHDDSRASGDAAADDDEEEDRIHCICGRNDDRGFMLFCDRCRVWLHGKCVSITKKTVPDVFICPRCQE